MTEIPVILGDVEELIKLIFGVLFVLIVVAASALSGGKKKPQGSGPGQRSWEDIVRDLAGESPRERGAGEPPPLPRQAPPPLPKRKEAGPRRPGKLPRKPVKRAPAAPPPVRAAEPIVETPSPSMVLSPSSATTGIRSAGAAEGSSLGRTEVGASEIGSKSEARAAPKPTGAGAVAAFLRPETLRQQFILTEILRPPVGLRRSE